jgi:hypothetical protein
MRARKLGQRFCGARVLPHNRQQLGKAFRAEVESEHRYESAGADRVSLVKSSFDPSGTDKQMEARLRQGGSPMGRAFRVLYRNELRRLRCGKSFLFGFDGARRLFPFDVKHVVSKTKPSVSGTLAKRHDTAVRVNIYFVDRRYPPARCRFSSRSISARAALLSGFGATPPLCGDCTGRGLE